MTKPSRQKATPPSPRVQLYDHSIYQRRNRRWLTVALLVIVILVTGLVGVFSLMNEANAPEGRRAAGVVYASARMGGAVLSPIKSVLW